MRVQKSYVPKLEMAKDIYISKCSAVVLLLYNGLHLHTSSQLHFKTTGLSLHFHSSTRLCTVEFLKISSYTPFGSANFLEFFSCSTVCLKTILDLT